MRLQFSTLGSKKSSPDYLTTLLLGFLQCTPSSQNEKLLYYLVFYNVPQVVSIESQKKNMEWI